MIKVPCQSRLHSRFTMRHPFFRAAARSVPTNVLLGLSQDVYYSMSISRPSRKASQKSEMHTCLLIKTAARCSASLRSWRKGMVTAQQFSLWFTAAIPYLLSRLGPATEYTVLDIGHVFKLQLTCNGINEFMWRRLVLLPVLEVFVEDLLVAIGPEILYSAR